MTKLKVWLLLLVALLLPFKGAMAAAGMFCHLGSSQSMSAISPAQQHHAVEDAGGEHHQGELLVSNSGANDDGALNLSGSCAFCSAVCGAPPLPRAGIFVHAASPSGAERFPALAPPRPSSVRGGLERPPRTI